MQRSETRQCNYCNNDSDFLIFDLSQEGRKKTSRGILGLESGSKILDHKNVCCYYN